MVNRVWGRGDTEHFDHLSPDRILNAVEKTGVRCTGRVLQLNSMENRVFDVELEVDEDSIQSKYEKHRIAKFYRPGRWSQDQIHEEHEFLLDLKKEDIQVSIPLEIEEAVNSQKTIGLDPTNQLFFSIFDKIGGRTPQELHDSQLPILARSLARLHIVGKKKEASKRLQLNAQTYGFENLSYLLDSKKIDAQVESAFKKTVEEILENIDPLFLRFDQQRIHGDCHFGNILWSDNGPFWVDFDDMVRGPVVQDIWLLFPGRDEYSLEQRSQFIKSYSEISAFDHDSLVLVEPLRTLRMLHFSAWIAKRWSDQAFKNAFPYYGDYKYWQQQLTDLNAQLSLIKNSR